MATQKILSEAARKAQAKIDSRVELVEIAGRKVEALERLKERQAKELAAAEAEIVTAVADVLDEGGWSVTDAREFGLPVSQDARAELRRRKDARKHGGNNAGDGESEDRPKLAAVPDAPADDEGDDTAAAEG